METSKKKNQSFILMFLALFVMVAICISVVPYSTAYAATTESISLNAKVFAVFREQQRSHIQSLCRIPCFMLLKQPAQKIHILQLKDLVVEL